MATSDSAFVLRWEIIKATATLRGGKATSQEWKRGGFKWSVVIERDEINHAFFTLRCESGSDTAWDYGVAVAFHMFRSNGTINKQERRFFFDEHHCSHKHQTWVHWPDLIYLGYNVNGSVIVEVHIKKFNLLDYLPPIDLSKFASRAETNNVTFLLDDKSIVVSKDFLHFYSPVFASMFFGDFVEKGKKEVEIKDVEYDEFVALLMYIFPGTGIEKLSDEIVEPILKLADRFCMECTINKVEKFLVKRSSFPTAKKLHIADFYRLGELKDDCVVRLMRFNTSEVKAFKETPEFANLSEETKNTVLGHLTSTS